MKTTDRKSLERACSPDDSRPHLHHTFAATIWGHRWLVATDGHRLHALRDVPRHELGSALVDRPDAPPAGDVVYSEPESLELRMLLAPEALKPLRTVPRSWDVAVHAATAGCTVEAWVKGTRVMLPCEPGWPFATQGERRVSFELRYMLDAVAFVAGNALSVVNVYQHRDALMPLMLTDCRWPEAVKHPATRLALVMPRRMA